MARKRHTDWSGEVHIIGLDIVGYSTKPPNWQQRSVQEMNASRELALLTVGIEDYTWQNSGDGGYIIIKGGDVHYHIDIVELFCKQIADFNVYQKEEFKLIFRYSISVGVCKITEAHEQTYVTGDGINDCARLLNGKLKDGQIVVSGVYHDRYVEEEPVRSVQFTPLPDVIDKHNKKHQAYNFQGTPGITGINPNAPIVKKPPLTNDTTIRNRENVALDSIALANRHALIQTMASVFSFFDHQDEKTGKIIIQNTLANIRNVVSSYFTNDPTINVNYMYAKHKDDCTIKEIESVKFTQSQQDVNQSHLLILKSYAVDVEAESFSLFASLEKNAVNLPGAPTAFAKNDIVCVNTHDIDFSPGIAKEAKQEMLDYFESKRFNAFMSLPIPIFSADGPNRSAIGIINIEAGNPNFFDSLSPATFEKMIAMVNPFAILLGQVIKLLHRSG